MSELKTCLYDRHLALGAQMSPFGGFIMPIQYKGITHEHNSVRKAAGMFDVSHMGEIFVSGKDAEKFVNHIFTNDIAGLPAGKILYGMMLYPDGGTVDDLLVYKEFEPDHYLLVVNAANVAKDFGWIVENADGYEVLIENKSGEWGEIALQGPDAERIAMEIFGDERIAALEFYTYCECTYNGSRMIVSRTGYTGEDGFEIYTSNSNIVEIWDRLLAAGVEACGLGCRDTLRFEAGLPLYGHELSPEISPVMAGLGMFAKLDKEEFIGKEAVAAQKAGAISKKLVGIELHDKAIPRAGYPVLIEGREVGVVTTGYRSITLDKSLCFALVDREVSSLGTNVEIQIRKKTFPGTVIKKRFYNTNYKK